MTAPPTSRTRQLGHTPDITTALLDSACDEVWAVSDKSTASIRLLIFSRSTLVRCGLRFLLRPHGAIEILAEASTTQEFVRLWTDLKPPIVLLDLTDGGEQAVGPRLLAELRRRRPTLRVIVLVGSQSQQEVNALLAAGVAGVIGAELSPSIMVKAIAQVSSGHGYFDRGEGPGNFRQGASWRPREQSSLLSRREHQVLQLLAVGHTNSDIGRQLHITESTAKFHMQGLRRKLGVSSRTAVVYAATQQGLL